ncbi:hypothetical protein K435DRAFT_875936 [Dendrothele bispora CBS 962.96]|uniref:Uncharacterized protein n=1 Tax=Dendrothele bispora (strain CBS 962.96) TaxID=1314807 RepID=A0A4S8KUA9_DENBC|nr:hypothetical protein K435DRAFT_875936 [Dendrothele bispora CBS 962.96]
MPVSPRLGRSIALGLSGPPLCSLCSQPYHVIQAQVHPCRSLTIPSLPADGALLAGNGPLTNFDTTAGDPTSGCSNLTFLPLILFLLHNSNMVIRTLPDIKLYKPAGTGSGSFPSSAAGNTFVSFHGSFNRDPPTGYGIVQVLAETTIAYLMFHSQDFISVTR